MDAPRLAIAPLAVVLDVDGTLLSGNINGNKQNNLTLAARLLLEPNNNPEHALLYAQEYENLGHESRNNPNEMSTPFISFYAKNRFEQFFKNVAEVNRSHDTQVISVKVMTMAFYKRNEMYAVLTKHFPHFKEICPTVEAFGFYNCKDLYGEEDYDWPQGCRKIDAALTKVDSRGRTVELLKGEHMKKVFPLWKTEMPGLTEENVYLIDDKNSLVLGARECGFSGILFPTMSDTLDIEAPMTFEEIFETINTLATSRFAPASKNSGDIEFEKEELQKTGIKRKPEDDDINERPNKQNKVDQQAA